MTAWPLVWLVGMAGWALAMSAHEPKVGVLLGSVAILACTRRWARP